MDQASSAPSPTPKPAWYRRKSTIVVGVIGALAVVGGVKQSKDQQTKREQAAQAATVAAAKERRADSLERALRDSLNKSHTDSLAALTPEQKAAGERKHKADSLQLVRAQAHIADSTRRAIAAEKRNADRARATALANSQRAARGTASSPYKADTYNGHTVMTGPRGGRYYINGNGKKTYIRD